jgi:hypothetical protein
MTSPIKIGFSGTSDGMTLNQKYFLRKILVKSQGEFHHGDCVGSDAQAHDIAEECLLEIVIHPPLYSKYRAFKKTSRILDPKEYLARNWDIAMACDELIATPKGLKEELRSGTWATVRYFKKLVKPVTLIFPDGTIEFHSKL